MTDSIRANTGIFRRILFVRVQHVHFVVNKPRFWPHQVFKILNLLKCHDFVSIPNDFLLDNAQDFDSVHLS